MKILKVIHGYPMRYNAGSEVYSQTLCHGLVAAGHEVEVFTREEDPFGLDFALRTERDPDEARIPLHLVNVPRSRDRYRHDDVDRRFAEVLDRLRPDVVHVGHLNHLSTSLVHEAAGRSVPVVYTLHDYWVMCPRGQFMQMHPEDPKDLWAACEGQEDRKCAERCYARYFSGAPEERDEDARHWTRWVARRMKHLREVTERVDRFVAPAQYLLRRYRDEFGLPPHKLTYLDYGFDRARLAGRRRTTGEPFTFGYIGTHIPAKGIHQLLAAFGRVRGDARLRIWGRPRGQETESLRALARALPDGAASRIEWLPEYRNQDIIADVFERVDAIVVPSVWVENSPLVIHEAQQARVPVVTADVGGMAEYVRHEVNGLVFRHRDEASLAAQMQRLADDPATAARLGARGYLFSDDGDVPDLGAHVDAVVGIYRDVIARRAAARVEAMPGPWRITFDTNPDTCNLKCVMCEEHSPHSLLQIRRKEEGRPRREMPIALIRSVIAEAAGRGLREVIPSTMGEPLLYEHFEEIVALCREHHVKLNLTTNGTWPRLGARRWAERIVPVTSDVKVSWNGATARTQESIMVGSDLASMLDDLRVFLAVRDAHAASGGDRCRVTFQLTFLEDNVGELADIVRLAASLGVDRVKGHHLWAHFDAIATQSMRRSRESVARWNRAVDEAHAAARDARLPHGGAVLLENIVRLDPDASADRPPEGRCPFLGREAWINTEGRFDPCCAPDAQRRTLGDFGRVDDQGLAAIWRGDAYRHLLSTWHTRALCAGCTMRLPKEDAR